MLSTYSKSIVNWFHAHPAIVWLGFGLTLTTVVAAVFVVPWMVVRIPPDYFAHRRAPQTPWSKLPPLARAAAIAAKNLAGIVLLLAGLVMLFVPGPGVVTALVGLALLDIPGKRALERWIVARPTIFATLNKLRAKYHQPPLEPPQPS